MSMADTKKLLEDEASTPYSECQSTCPTYNCHRGRTLNTISVVFIALTSTLAAILTASLFPSSFNFVTSSKPLQPHHSTKPVLVDASLLKKFEIHQSEDFGPYITCPPASSSAETMRAAGCSFDLLVNGWVPNPCFDQPLHNHFTDDKNYIFFEDLNGTQIVHQDEVMQGDLTRWPDGLYVSFREHFQHCRYMIDAVVHALQPPFTGVLDLYHNEEHVLHCVRMLQQPRREDNYIDPDVKAFFTVHKCYVGL